MRVLKEVFQKGAFVVREHGAGGLVILDLEKPEGRQHVLFVRNLGIARGVASRLARERELVGGVSESSL